MIASWAALGTASGGALGAVTRRMLRTRAFGWRAWIISAVLTGILFAALTSRMGQDHALLPFSYLAAVLVPLAAVDLAEQRLPSAVLLPSYAILGASLTTVAVLDARYESLARSLITMAALAAAYLVLALATGGLGAGDVKLAGLLGLALGWISWQAVLTGTVLGWLLAATTRLTLRASRRIERDTPTPLGPHLAMGAMTAVISAGTG
ncbi:prepilin peptidase [Actinokineospora globicatena]|uniref:prepilin peptidase n=1 Tax=Actinokineospora globicatena TaxID=103729 RepID=UPI0020A27CE3|nr:prepilin peptidase [Actinokineospora globicatena]MCP2304045.1 leader peptidase (prepilin peptidase) / N-methyltransferase [Actinokineospora globicatena]